MTRLKLANPNKDSLILSGPVTIQRDIPESTVVRNYLLSDIRLGTSRF